MPEKCSLYCKPVHDCITVLVIIFLWICRTSKLRTVVPKKKITLGKNVKVFKNIQ